MALIVPKGWVFLFLLNGKSTCWPLKYDKLFGDENEPPFQTDITLSLTKNFRVFPHFGLIYARSCQNISLEYDRNYKNRSLRSYLGCCQDIFKIHNSRNPAQIEKLLVFLKKYRVFDEIWHWTHTVWVTPFLLVNFSLSRNRLKG